MESIKDMDYMLANIVLDQPLLTFSVGTRAFNFWSVTLAKILYLKPRLADLGIRQNLVAVSPSMEAWRIVRQHKDKMCHIIAIHSTPNTFAAFHDTAVIEERSTYLASELSDENAVQLFLYAMTLDKTSELMEYLGIDREQQRVKRIMDVKEQDSTSVSIGGASIFGSFVGQLKKMGFTDEEIFFTRSYTYLHIMLADQVNTIFLSKDEHEKLPNDISGVVMADDPSAVNKLRAILEPRGMTIK